MRRSRGCRRCRIIRIVVSPLIVQLWHIWGLLVVVRAVFCVTCRARDVDFVKGKSKHIGKGRVARKTAFIEHCMRRNEHFLRSRVPESPGLGALRVAYEDTLASVRFQGLAVLLAHKDIGQRAKDTKVGHIWLLSIALPGSIGYVAT